MPPILIENILLVASVAALFLGLLLGYLVTHIRNMRLTSSLRNRICELEIRLESVIQRREENLQQFEMQKDQLGERFYTMSLQVLRQNNASFLDLAKEKLTQHQIQANHELDKKHQGIDDLITPIKESLDKTRDQLVKIEKDRIEAEGSLKSQLYSMTESQNQLNLETRKLTQAFRRPEVRGQWGELTLKRLVELAGMVEHCDFTEQTTAKDDDGYRFRPDMIIRMPARRDIIVDSKTPLDAYLDAIEAQNDEDKASALNRHLRQVKLRIKELAGKAYWQQFDRSPEFVVLFIPGDQFLNAALDLDRSLVEEALKNKVILATPTSFVALLRAVAFGWRQEQLTENAEEIRKLGEDMYSRIAGFTENFSRVGKSLDQSVSHYNKAVATFSTRVIPSAKKLQELGISEKKSITVLEPVEKSSRTADFDKTDIKILETN